MQMAKILSFFMAEEYSIVYMYHISFIHSSVEGHLGCFHNLAIVNNTTMNRGMQIHLYDPVFIPFAYICRSAMLSQMVGLILIFLKTSILFFIVTASIYIPIDSAQWFPFLHILSDICYLLSF